MSDLDRGIRQRIITMDNTIKRMPADCNRVNALLLHRYMEVLDIDRLGQISSAETQGLSGLFLPAVNEDYLRSDVRIMLVGKEPRGWGTPLHRLAEGEQTRNALRDYVRKQMLCHYTFAQRAHGTSKFRQFHTQLAAQVGGPSTAVAWGNLLCVSLNKGSPVEASNFAELAELSQRLLLAQIDVLAPDLIVFASGYGYDRFIKRLFRHYCTLPGFVSRKFWPFALPGLTACRVIHPQRHTRDYAQFVLDAVHADVERLRAAAPPAKSLEDLLLGPQAQAAASEAVRQAVARANAAGLPRAYEPDFSQDGAAPAESGELPR